MGHTYIMPCYLLNFTPQFYMIQNLFDNVGFLVVKNYSRIPIHFIFYCFGN